MKCPNCGTPEKALVKVCSSCNEAYASQDLVELQKIEYLLKESASWRITETIREPYREKFEILKARLLREPVPMEEPLVAVPEPEPVKVKPVKVKPVPAPKPALPREKVPFDQWLLSERNIKIALYSGAGLLVLAGLIFVGVNWASFPGPARFAVTFMVTGLMYLGGYIFFQRPTLRLGGNALLGIASGFFTLNFVVLQMYVVEDTVSKEVMWLIASPLCFLLYIFTANWTKSDLFTYISLAAVGSTLTAALVVLQAPLMVYVLAYAILMLIILGLSQLLRDTRVAEFTVSPLKWVSQIGMALVLITSISIWLSDHGCTTCDNGSPWLAVISLFVGVLFYVAVDIFTKSIYFRWVSSILFTVALGLAMLEGNFSRTALGAAFMLQALVYLGIGYALKLREEQKHSGLPFYLVAYFVAFAVSVAASSDVEDFAKILLGDVVLLGVSAYVHKDYRWVYSAVWLFMWPIYLFITLIAPELHTQGLLMSILGINYIVAGYLLGQRELRLGGPFLTAAAFLTVTTVVMTWSNPLTSSLVLAVVAVLYLSTALWRDWPEMLLPMLLAVNLLVLQLNGFSDRPYSSIPALIISFTMLGVICVLGGRGLQRPGLEHWAWPFYLAGVIDLVGAYPASLFEGGWLAVGISAIVAILLLAYAWLERSMFSEKAIFPILPYLGVGVVFIAHFFVMDVLGGQVIWDIWPGITAGLCAVFTALSWSLRGREAGEVYETPLRYAGLGLMIIPLVGSVTLFEPLLSAVTFAICGAAYLTEAGLRRITFLPYVAIGAIFISHFYLLDVFGLLNTWDYEGLFVWPIFTTGLCVLFVVLSWLLRGRKSAEVFETPLRLAGLGLMLIPVVGSMVIYDYLLSTVVLVIGGTIYLAEAGLRRVELQISLAGAGMRQVEILVYLGIAAFFASHFYLLAYFKIWPWASYTAGLCALFVAIALLLRGRKSAQIFETPFRLAGLALMVIPLVGAVSIFIMTLDSLTGAITFAIAGAVYGVDAAVRKNLSMAYLGVAAFVVVVWAVLDLLGIHEPQAFVIPVGAVLLGAGWYERVRVQGRLYRLFTTLGLILLLGSAFIQSQGPNGVIFAILLAVESILSVAWGIRNHLRGFVQLGVVALIANAVVQLGPGFMNLDNWIKIGVTGSILLGGGLFALFKREQLLDTRQKLTDEWRSWEP